MPIPTNQLELDQDVLNYKSLKLQNFNSVLTNKIIKIAAYLQKANISNVVVGVSGGIDSAVVIALLCKVKELIPLTIRAYTIHFDLYDGIFDPNYVDDLKNKFGDKVKFKTIDASKTLDTLFDDLKVKMSVKHYDNILRAQSSYALRYQMLFTYAQTYGAVTIGTTNRDEFEYSGWFGKNSDMVVDLQVIADWHKFEVIKAAEMLDVPQSIIDRKPVGDLLDKSTDEENFGCTYNELAYFAYLLKHFEDNNQFLIDKFAKLKALHQKNIHKYQGQTFNPIFIK